MKTEEDIRHWWNSLDSDTRVLTVIGTPGSWEQCLISGEWDKLSSAQKTEAMIAYSRIVGGN